MAKQPNTLTKQESVLEENATEFGKCFVLYFSEKLLLCESFLKSDVKKALIEKGEIHEGWVGGLLSIIDYVADGTGMSSFVMKCIGKIYQGGKVKLYEKEIATLGELIREILCNAKEFTETLASVSIDIFQCYEMQFTHVLQNNSETLAMHFLAKDAVERAFEHLKRNQRTSINQSILYGKSTTKCTWNRKCGYSIDFKFESSSFEYRTSDIYEKPGIVTHSEGQHQFWKRKDGNSEPSKYGYRLLSCEEDWNTIRHQYKKDTDAKYHFAQYEYLLNLGKKASIIKNVIENAKKKGALTEERLQEIFLENNKEITKAVAEGNAEVRESLNELKTSMSHLDEGGYVKNILKSLSEGQKTLQESMEKAKEQSNCHYDQAYVHRDQIFQKINDKLDGLMPAEEQSQKKLGFGLLTPVKSFTGRDVEMAKIQKEFETSDKALDPRPIICISGLGGIGKTELARKYAYEYGKEFDDNVIWVNAQNPTSLRESFLEFVRAKIPKEREKYEGMKETINIVHEVYMELNKRKCLIIFDNIESISVFKEIIPHLPKGQRTPCIIITSQSKEWKNVKVIELKGLTCEEAVRFIRNGLEGLELRESTHEEDIKLLADKLQCFPLALQQAVAYIKQKCVKKMNYSGTKFDIKDYLKTFDEQTKDLLTFNFDNHSDNRYTKTTFTTWKITMDKIKDDPDYGGQSEEILNMLSYFYPDNIHTDLFKGLGVSNEILEDVVSLLERYSMITDTDKRDCSFNIHRLVQIVVRINLVHEGKEEDVLYKTAKLFYDHKQHEKKYDINWDYERIMHVITSWEYGIKYKEIVKSFSELPKWVLYKLVGEGKFREAVNISKISIEEWKKHAIINENTLDVMHWLTMYPDESIETIKKIDDTLEYHREFLEKLKTKSTNDQIEIWSRVGSKGGYFKRTKDLLDKRKDCIGEIKNSDIKLYKDFLNDCRANLGDNHSLTLYAMFSIADLHMKKKKISEATTAYREVFNKSKEFLGYENWLTYDVMNRLTNIFKDDEKFEEAIEIYQEFVNGCKETLGLDHEHALTVNIKLADLLVRNKNIDEAIAVYEELLNRRLKLDANGLTLIVLGKVAKLFVRQGYLDKAIEAHKDLLKENEGKDQKQTLKTLEVIGRLHKQAGNMSEALLVYYEILELQNGTSDYGNKLILPTMKNIETILIKLGRIEEAIKMYKELLGHLENTSSDIKSSLYIMNNIAILLEKSDEVQEAFEMYISLHKKETEMLGCKNVSFKSLAKIGDLSKKSKKIGSIDNAIKIYEKFLSECKKNLEPKDKKTWQAMEILANLLRDNGNIEEALGLYLEILSEKKGDALNDMGLNSALMDNLTALTQRNLNIVEVEKVYKNFHIE